ncbi:MAG: hypothetical protein J7497_00630 [Chitinophagaceae bacterium]|nr:hypothetical protein [Chitinophagaceae bacterium]
MVLDKLFGWVRKKEKDPQIPFGRYSDNNKSVQQVEQWTEADRLFKENNYRESIDAFFDYLCDDEQQNVEIEKNNGIINFKLYQGSKLVRGHIEGDMLNAEIALARMPEPSMPVMRRLLEMNFNLYYSRYSLKGDIIYMRFDSKLNTATPNKLYYGLKELATKADKQDDLLLNEFKSLEHIDVDHVSPIPIGEQVIKLRYLRDWIKSTLEYVETLDPDKFSGAISYLLLTLVFRIDYLISPEGKILSELEKIASTYYGKEDKNSSARNPSMIAGFRKILEKSDEEIAAQLFRSKYTFAIVVPQSSKQVSEAIETALENMTWYRDNNYPDIANEVMEYGFAYSQYSYSLPKPLTELFKLFMQINHAGYFEALGFHTKYYKAETNDFEEDDIIDRIELIINEWRPKYSSLGFKTRKLRFDTLVNFNQSFLEEVAELNLD